jgi:hypothetical protein
MEEEQKSNKTNKGDSAPPPPPAEQKIGLITLEQFLNTAENNAQTRIILTGKAQECGSDLEPKSQENWEALLTKAKNLGV